MELTLERTPDTALLNGLTCTLWDVVANDEGDPIGKALIAEIVAAPGPDATEVRQLLTLELNGRRPRITVKSTDCFAATVDMGVPARLWIGHSADGLGIVAFIPAITPLTADFATLLEEQLMPCAIAPTVIAANGLPSHIDGLRADAPLR